MLDSQTSLLLEYSTYITILTAVQVSSNISGTHETYKVQNHTSAPYLHWEKVLLDKTHHICRHMFSYDQYSLGDFEL